MAASCVYDGLLVQTELNADNIISDSADTGSGLAGTDMNVTVGAGDGVGAGGTLTVTSGTGGASGDGGDINMVSGDSGATSGDAGDINITSGNSQSPTGAGGDVNVISGQALNVGGTGDSGNINITGSDGFNLASSSAGGSVNIKAGVGDGGAADGDINFSARGGANFPYNDIANVDLAPTFTATSVIGALNELKGDVNNDNIDQDVYTSLTDLDYNGSTIVDVPGTVDIVTGDWLIGFSLTFTTSTPTEPVAVFVRDGSDTIIAESKTFLVDNSNNSRHTVSKQFVYTEGAANNTLKISYQLNAGAATTVAVEMTPLGGTTDPDQIPLIWANKIDTSFEQNTYTTIADLNYNGTSEVDVPGSITLTAGDWLIGYSVTLRTPSTSPDDILVYVQDGSNTIVDASRTHLADNTTFSRHSVSKAFIFTATATTYRLTFRLNSTATVSPAVEMSALSGVTDPDQVPVLWAYRLDSATSDQNVYTTATDINYNGTTEVDIPGTITVTDGVWLMGYSAAISAPNLTDSTLVHVRDSSDNIVSLSKTFLTETNTTSRHTVSRAFLFTQGLSTEDYKLSFRLNATAATNVAVDMTSLALSPGQAPVLWAIKVGEIATSNTFLGLSDTPGSYVGQTGKIVAVNGAETAMEFVDQPSSTVNNPAISIISVNTNVVGNPAVTGVTVEKTNIMRINSEILLTAVFSVDTIAGATNTEFTFSLPSAATLTNEWDLTAPVSAWVDSSPAVALSETLCIGVAASTNALCKFTAVNGTDTHYFQVNARYTAS